VPSELSAAIRAARAAGKILERHFELEKSPLHKGPKAIGDFATHADLAAEKIIVGELRSKFPGYGILAEEGGAYGKGKRAQARWIIDPLDGTHNFFFGIPIFGTSIALE